MVIRGEKIKGNTRKMQALHFKWLRRQLSVGMN